MSLLLRHRGTEQGWAQALLLQERCLEDTVAKPSRWCFLPRSYFLFSIKTNVKTHSAAERRPPESSLALFPSSVHVNVQLVLGFGWGSVFTARPVGWVPPAPESHPLSPHHPSLNPALELSSCPPKTFREAKVLGHSSRLNIYVS